jgi:prepilin-type N-terminal cleavage/methylation domain-containing protein
MMKLKFNKGFSLVEVIVAATIFSVVAMAIYQGFISITSLISASRDKVVAIDLINSEFELVRNLSYSNVGLQNGIPSGVLLATTTSVIDGRAFDITRVIRNIDDPFDGTLGGSPNDLSPADYKMVQIGVSCSSCKKPLDISATANVSSKNLEATSTNGSLFIRVFNGSGVPVPEADVSVTNSTVGVSINETTNNDGLLAIVDAPPASNSYRIIASKDGYTTDRTYASSVGNPHPVKPDATVLLQQVTQISFIIDKVSTINVFSKDLQCNFIANVPFSIAGAKLIGTNPDVLKFSGSFSTDSSGSKTLDDIEWGSFTLTPTGGFNLIGVNPPSPFSVLPDSVQNVDMIFAEGEPNNLLVTVKDNITKLPLSGVNLTLTQGSFSAVKITGRGYLDQTEWSGNGDDGNIETNSPAGELKLLKVLGSYVPSGVLTSAVFDTGTSTNFTSIVWTPTDQPPQTGTDPVKFKIATASSNTSTTTWNFLGPDGTAGSFYTKSNNNINSIHNGDRYLKYKIFLSTDVSNKTPNVSDVAVTYTSDCIPPGQALFSGLSHGNHDLLLEKSGYQTQEFPVNIITNGDWQSIEANLIPG